MNGFQWEMKIWLKIFQYRQDTLPCRYKIFRVFLLINKKRSLHSFHYFLLTTVYFLFLLWNGTWGGFNGTEQLTYSRNLRYFKLLIIDPTKFIVHSSKSTTSTSGQRDISFKKFFLQLFLILNFEIYLECK